MKDKLLLWFNADTRLLAVEDPTDARRHWTLAQDLGNGSGTTPAEPYFSCRVGSEVPHAGFGYVTGSGNVVLFVEATPYDVAGMLARFKPQYPAEEWVRSLPNRPSVTPPIMAVIQEGFRIFRAAQVNGTRRPAAPRAPELSVSRGGARQSANLPQPKTLLPPELPQECPCEQDSETGCCGCRRVITDEAGEFLGCVAVEGKR